MVVVVVVEEAAAVVVGGDVPVGVVGVGAGVVTGFVGELGVDGDAIAAGFVGELGGDGGAVVTGSAVAGDGSPWLGVVDAGVDRATTPPAEAGVTVLDGPAAGLFGGSVVSVAPATCASSAAVSHVPSPRSPTVAKRTPTSITRTTMITTPATDARLQREGSSGDGGEALPIRFQIVTTRSAGGSTAARAAKISIGATRRLRRESHSSQLLT